MSFKDQLAVAIHQLTHRNNSNNNGNKRPLVSFYTKPNDPLLDNPYFQWFLDDEKVRRCIVINAGFATLTSGFSVEFEVIAPCPDGFDPVMWEQQVKKKYEKLLNGVNSVNAKVNFDIKQFYSLIFLQIYGKIAWLKIPNKESIGREPKRLVVLPVKIGTDDGLQPMFNDEREVTKYVLQDGKDSKTYMPKQVLYYAYMDLADNLQGLSILRSVLHACQTRYEIRMVHYPKSLIRTWKAPFATSVDTSGFTDSDEDIAKEKELMKNVSVAVDSGINFAVNQDLKVQPLKIDVKLLDLLAIERAKSEEIIAAFGTAPFLVNQLSANFATAHVEYDSFIAGTITDLQRFLKRENEASWYPCLMKELLSEAEYNEAVKEVRLKQVWRPAKKMSNVKEMVEIANALFDKGFGICGTERSLAADVAGLSELAGALEELDKPTAKV